MSAARSDSRQGPAGQAQRPPRAVVGFIMVLLLFSFAYLSPYFVTWQYNQLDTSAFLSPHILQPRPC